MHENEDRRRCCCCCRWLRVCNGCRCEERRGSRYGSLCSFFSFFFFFCFFFFFFFISFRVDRFRFAKFPLYLFSRIRIRFFLFLFLFSRVFVGCPSSSILSFSLFFSFFHSDGYLDEGSAGDGYLDDEDEDEMYVHLPHPSNYLSICLPVFLSTQYRTVHSINPLTTHSFIHSFIRFAESRGVVSKFGAGSLQSRLVAMRLKEEQKRAEKERTQGYIAKVGSAVGWGASWFGL